MPAKITINKEFILSRIILQEKTNCWIWSGPYQTHGYAYFPFKEAKEKWKTQIGHRIAYMLFKGPIEKGLTLDHLCNIKACINPKHLEPVTQRENNRRRDIVLGKDMSVFPCGHDRVGPHVHQKRAGVRKNGNIIYQDVCRPCMLKRAKEYNARRKSRAAANNLHSQR